MNHALLMAAVVAFYLAALAYSVHYARQNSQTGVRRGR